MSNRSSEFLQQLQYADESRRQRLATTYDAWDDATKTAADQRAKFAKKIDDQFSPELIAEELQHGLEHTADLTFLSTLRQWAETRINDRLTSPTYPQAYDDETQQAVDKFHIQLSQREQALVLRAFAIEMMDAFGGMLENGADDPACPVDWVLVNPHTGNPVANSLHAVFDGDPKSDETYLPRIAVIPQDS